MHREGQVMCKARKRKTGQHQKRKKVKEAEKEKQDCEDVKRERLEKEEARG